MTSDLTHALKAKRAALGIGVRQVAEEAGVSFATVARVERGCVPSERVAAALDAWLRGEPHTTLAERVDRLEDQVEQLADQVARMLRLLLSVMGAIS